VILGEKMKQADYDRVIDHVVNLEG